jgi:hypothetical protein
MFSLATSVTTDFPTNLPIISSNFNSNNTNLSAYLDSKYPTLEDKRQIKEIIVEWDTSYWFEYCNLSNAITQEQAKELVGGELDLTAYSQLEVVVIAGDCLKTPLVSLNISQCINLKILSVSQNQLTQLDLRQNVQLEELYLDDNNFSAQNVSFLSHLVNLKILSLSNHVKDRIEQNVYNRFHGSLKSLKLLTKLEKLFIRNTDLSSGFKYLHHNLQQIDCSCEERTESKVRKLENSLEKSSADFIIINNNYFRKISPQTWLDQKYPNKEETTEIDFSNNGSNNFLPNIRGKLIINYFPNLQVIKIEQFTKWNETKCSDLQRWNFGIKNVTKVIIKNCPLLQKIDLRSFRENKVLIIDKCPQLCMVDCSFNSLVKLVIQEKPSLEKVIIDNYDSSCQISDFLKSDSWVFFDGEYAKRKNANAQEWLDLTYPKSERESCTSIVINAGDILEGSLKLEGFINLKEFSFLGNKNLTYLDLSDCQNLQSLDFPRLSLTDLSFLRTIPQPTKLTYLGIDNNNFPEQDLTFLRPFINLECLSLGSWDKDKLDRGIYNRFTGSLEHLQEMSKLQELDISNTDLDSGVELLPPSLKKITYSIDENLPVNVRKIKESLDSLFIRQKLNEMCPDKNEEEIDNLLFEIKYGLD